MNLVFKGKVKDYELKKVKKSKRKLQIVVLGSSKAICSKLAYNLAFEVGVELAKSKVTTVSGGGHGVMEAAMKGAKSKGGTTMAILPWESMKRVNDYADFVVATGIGWSRNSININSADGCIVVHGGAGTLNEATYAYMMNKPTVALSSSGGVAFEIAGKFFDERETETMVDATTPKDAVNKVLNLIKEHEKKFPKPTDMDMALKDTEEYENTNLKKHVKIKDAKNKS